MPQKAKRNKTLLQRASLMFCSYPVQRYLNCQFRSGIIFPGS